MNRTRWKRIRLHRGDGGDKGVGVWREVSAGKVCGCFLVLLAICLVAAPSGWASVPENGR